MRFSAIPATERNKTIHAGCPIVLQCELSDPSAQVHWYKDGSKLPPQSGVDILTDGFVRILTVHAAEFFHSGLYSCKTRGDTITFSVNVKGDLKFYFKKREKLTISSSAKQLTLVTLLCAVCCLSSSHSLKVQLNCHVFFDCDTAC